MNSKFATIALLALLTPGLMPGSTDDGNGQIREIRFQKFVEPNYPHSLGYEGVVEGIVDIAVDINDDGTIADWIALSSTHPRFTREIDRVIHEWIFEPVLRDGEAIPIVVQIRFRFTLRGVITLTAGDMTNLFLNRMSGRQEEERLVVDLPDLDKIPIPVEVVHPMQIEGLPREEAIGRVLIEFIIDTEGNVRLPVVHEIEGPIELAYSAYSAITSWKFDPPLRNGKPVAVRARQRFVFSSAQE